MGRARQLKPAFFKDEDISRLSAHARLCFQGLWTLADKRGRLEDRPLFIKSEIFPYETVSVDEMLAELSCAREYSGGAFITRYAANEKKYIQINNFEKHQNCHPKEPDSVIPEPPAKGRVKPRKAAKGRVKTGTSRVNIPLPSSSSLPSLPSLPSIPSLPSGSESATADSWPEWYAGITWDKSKRKVEFTGEAKAALSKHLNQLAEEESLPPMKRQELQRGWGRLSGYLLRNRQCTGQKSLPPIVVNWFENDLRDQRRIRGPTSKKQQASDVFAEALQEALEEENESEQ